MPLKEQKQAVISTSHISESGIVEECGNTGSWAPALKVPTQVGMGGA